MTNCKKLLETYVESASEGYACRESGPRLWLSTPFTHLDGDAVEVALREQRDGSLVASDLGETLRQLATLGYDPRSTPNGRFLMAQIAKQYRIETDDDGILFRRLGYNELGEALTELINAMLAVGNLVFLARSSRPATIQEEIADYLSESGVLFRQRVRIDGRSGKHYTVDFGLGADGTAGFVKAISAASVSGITGATNAAIRLWYDLPETWKATVVDDRAWDWREVDLTILRSLSSVFRWSDGPEEFGRAAMRQVEQWSGMNR